MEVYLGIDLPDCIVCSDDDVPSNSTPMDMLWEAYSSATAGDDPTKTFYLYFAARDTFKSLVASIFEALCLFNLRRDVGHLAAVESQAKNVTKYLKNYLKRPILREFRTGNNERTVEVTFYKRPDGTILTPAEHAGLTPPERDQCSAEAYFVQILVATMQGTNSLHTSCIILDELDLAPPGPVEEALMIPAPGKVRGELPITLMTSTRKFAFGPVQKMMDEAGRSGLIVRHWNLLDMTRRCPPTRHRPDLPRLPIYRSDETLEACGEEKYASLNAAEQQKFVKDEGYAGCLQNCRMFAPCRGRLATRQTSSSPLLKSVDHTQAQLTRVSVEKAKAQYLCWKPSSEGMIYPRLSPEVHLITAAQMAELLTGEPSTIQTKEQLVALFRERGCEFHSGMDWGSTHPFAEVVGAKDGARMFVFQAAEVPELEIGQMMDLCDQLVKPYAPAVWPDTAYPAYIKLFRRAGYSVREWPKNAGSVKNGIEVVRFKLRPALGAPPQLYFLKGDPGCELLVQRMQHYHWKLDSAGRPTEVPDDVEDDLCDALRYMVMNVFKSSGKLSAPPDVPDPTIPVPMPLSGIAYHPNTWMQDAINEALGLPPGAARVEDRQGPTAAAPKKKPGRIFWSID